MSNVRYIVNNAVHQDRPANILVLPYDSHFERDLAKLNHNLYVITKFNVHMWQVYLDVLHC